MEEVFDANVPDTTNGDFFCTLCLVSANSDGMWKSHIAGKRHLRNMQKYPNGLPRGYVAEDDDETYDAPPPKYGRYENEEWNNYPPRETDMYPRTWDYVPEIRPQITIDYAHKKTLPEAQSLLNQVTNPSFSLPNTSSKENFEDPLIKLLTESKFILNKFEEESIRQKLKGALDNSSSNQSNKNAAGDDDFEKELDALLGKSSDGNDSKQKDQNSYSTDSFRKQINEILQGRGSKSGPNQKDGKPGNNKDSKSNSDRKIPSKTNSADQRYSNDKKRLDKDSSKDTRKYDRNSNRDKRYERDSGKSKSYGRDSDRDKKRYDKDLDKNKKNSDRNLDRGRNYRNSSRRKRSRSSSSSSSSSSDSRSSDSSSSSSGSDRRRRSKTLDKKGPSKDPPKTKVVDKDSENRLKNKGDDSIFLDAFHKMNDKKLFDVPDTEEPDSSSSWKKPTKVEGGKLDNIDPDKLTPDSVDDLLSSYLKSKTNPSIGKGLDEKTSSNTVAVNKLDDPDTLAEKLEHRG